MIFSMMFLIIVVISNIFQWINYLTDPYQQRSTYECKSEKKHKKLVFEEVHKLLLFNKDIIK